ncbi:MAG: sodium:proton antiporter [Cyanobium sp.]
MARLIVISLRLLIWLLLSADLEAANVAIGLAVALALPLPRQRRALPLAELGAALLASLRAIPLAYREAFVLLLRRPGREVELLQAADFRPSGPLAALVFLDVFRITITPLTIALGMDAGGRCYRVHRLEAEP